MSFEGHMKDATVRPTLTTKAICKSRGNKGGEVSVSNHDPVKDNNK